jgi:hypothetical protein
MRLLFSRREKLQAEKGSLRIFLTSTLAFVIGGLLWVEAAVAVTITVTEYPLGLVAPIDQVTVRWTEDTPVKSSLKYGTAPGNYSLGEIPETGNEEVTFVPEQQEGLTAGIYYCVIAGDEGSLSNEFLLVIESQTAPAMIGPVGNITTITPVFTWSKVLGVPYYGIVVSDTKIIISKDEQGHTIVEGLNVIWGTLTPENSGTYGDPDPSGNYISDAPGLVPGASYWWVVVNVYSNELSMISDMQAGVTEFTVDIPPPFSPPELLSPADGDTLTTDIIPLQWSPVEGAANYRIYIYELREENGSEVSHPVWDKVLTTSNTLYDYPAGLSLKKGVYLWKVAAVDNAGIEVPSPTRGFHYDVPLGKVKIYTYTGARQRRLPRVNIDIVSEQGVSEVLPIATDKDGHRNQNLAPGKYTIVARKAGYEDAAENVTVAPNEELDVHRE